MGYGNVSPHFFVLKNHWNFNSHLKCYGFKMANESWGFSDVSPLRDVQWQYKLDYTSFSNYNPSFLTSIFAIHIFKIQKLAQKRINIGQTLREIHNKNIGCLVHNYIIGLNEKEHKSIFILLFELKYGEC